MNDYEADLPTTTFEHFYASNGVSLIPGGAVSPMSFDRVRRDPNGASLVEAAIHEAIASGFPIRDNVKDMTVFRRNLALQRAGILEGFRDALDDDNWTLARQMAASVGHPLDLPAEEKSEANVVATSFSFTRIGDIIGAGLKPVEWLVRNYVEADSLALMFGDPGCGKSFAAIDLACCVATGTAWHGNRSTPGAVFYIAGEGQNGLARRFAAWAQHNGISLTGSPLFVSRRPAQLCNAAGAAEVAHAVEELEAVTGQKPAMIVIDTLARNFGGADENSAQDMGSFIANLDSFLRAKWRATVLVVHHSGHADKSRARGSTALKGALDAEYSLAKDDSGIVRIDATKMKDAEQPAPLAFKLETVQIDGLVDDEGVPVTSAVLWKIPHVAPARPGKIGRGRNQTLALSILAELIDEHRARLERGGFDTNGARVKLEEWRDQLAANGVDRKRFYDLRNTLKDAGRIVIEFGGYVRLAGDECPL